jgi:SAM-dependent methyltransferase
LKPRFRSKDLIYDIEIRELIQHALAFEAEFNRAKLNQAKFNQASHAAATAGLDWYPHDSFGTLSVLDQLLTSRERFLGTLIGKEPVVDVGCADGALSFVFESLGVEVHAIDNPPTNYNGMRGVRALKKALGSSVRIFAADLDSHFALPVDRCGLAVFFGILYHLKNPFGVLESLAARARYCLLSTAITRCAPGRGADLHGLPVAYLAGRDGLKGDETNYWIFTEAGLRVLVDRTGWDVCDWMVTGDSGATLWDTQSDERVFCLLRSRAFEPASRSQLLSGWHALENNAWRWTAKRFSIAVASAGTLTLRCTIPQSLHLPVILKYGESSTVFDSPGDHEVSVRVEPGVIEFEVDRCLAPDATDSRERGLIVRGVAITP